MQDVKHMYNFLHMIDQGMLKIAKQKTQIM